MKRILFILIAAGIAFAPNARAQESYQTHPGYVNLDDIDIPDDASEVVEVTIGPELLGMFTDIDMDDMADLEGLNNLIAINVKNFEIPERDMADIKKKMDKIDKQLRSQQWKQIVKVKKPGEFTNVSVKYGKKKDKSLGLMIMSLDESGSASFVNIVGGIDFHKLGQMGVKLNENTLDSLEKVMDKDKDFEDDDE